MGAGGARPLETGELQELEKAAIEREPQMDAQGTPEGPSLRVRFMSRPWWCPIHAASAAGIARLL